LYISGCGVPNTSPEQQADHKTHLYVGEAFTPDPSIGPPVGYVAQFRMANDGTLSSIGAAVAAGVLPDFASAVTPTNQNLLIPHEAISQFTVGSDGHITPTAGPTVTGSWIAFTLNGRFAIIANRVESTVSSYSVASSGALTLISTAATGWYPQGVAIDRAGKFAYVANWNDGTI
jgi:6-phosphogluconolactonase (cycloisomerase 2 family)